MENAVRQRIISILSEYKTNPTQFANGDSALQKRLSRQLKGGAAVTCETILGILDKYGDVSAEWLLRGKGEMTKQATNQETPVSTNNSDMESAFLKKEAFYLRQMNERLDDLIKANETIENLKEEVESLKKRLELAEQDSNKMAVNVVKHKFA